MSYLEKGRGSAWMEMDDNFTMSNKDFLQGLESLSGVSHDCMGPINKSDKIVNSKILDEIEPIKTPPIPKEFFE